MYDSYCKEKLDANHSSGVKGFIKQNQFGGSGSSYFYKSQYDNLTS